MKRTNIIGLSLFASLSLYGASSAVPNIGDALHELNLPKIKKEQKTLPALEGVSELPIKEFDSAQKIAIKNIRVDGIVHVKESSIKDIVSPYENRELSFGDIQELTTKITKYYREKGYFLARAYIPQQNINKQEGDLTIAVIEGFYGEFKLENNSLVKNSILQANLDTIKSNKIISTDTLERAMLIINDTPGATVSKTEARPGEEVGTSDFHITTEPTSRYSAYILGDNYGSLYTGRYRLIAGADINSPFGIGDKISIIGLTSESAGLLNARLAYDFALHPNGTRANISYAKTTYELGNKYKDLDAVGSSDSITLGVAYPLIRSVQENVNLYLDTSYNKMRDEIQVSKTNIKKDAFVGTFGIDFTKEFLLFTKNTQSKIDISYTLGNLRFNNQADREIDAAGAQTDGVFSKVNAVLAQDIDLNNKIRWENSLRMQYALDNKNLDGSQDLSIGGVYGVKYYPDGEESAENGYVFNTELFYRLPNYNEFTSSASLFYDIGRVYVSENFTSESSRTLQDVGVGYTGTYQSIYFNSYLAKNISGSQTTEDKNLNVKFLLQAGWIF